MTTVSERRQHLDFDPYWQVAKWDKSGEFIDGMSKAFDVSAALRSRTSKPANGPRDGVKAADVVGVRDAPAEPKIVFVAEFKDFVHPSIPPEQRAQAAEKSHSGELIDEIVRKVIDTLAGATFSHDSADNRRDELTEWRPALARSTTKIFVLMCVEELDPVFAGVLTKELQRRLKWLGKSATVLATTGATSTTGATPFSGAGISYRID